MPNIPDQSFVRDHIVDTVAATPLLSMYAFAAVSTSATFIGYFVDRMGRQFGAEISATITSGTPQTFTALYNTANSVAAGTQLPDNVVGFIGNHSQSMYVNRSADAFGNIATTPASISKASGTFAWGRATTP
jgi:hypothetical protein